MTGPIGPMAPDRTFVALSSERLVVRRLRPDDAGSLAAYRSDPGVARYQSWQPPMPIDAARRFIEAMADEHPDTPGRWFQYAIEERDTGKHIGDVASHTHDDPRIATIGVTLGREAQGNGYATEALGLLLAYLLIERRKHRVIGECDPRNTAVVRLLTRMGMRREAHHTQSYWDGAQWTDEYVFAVLADEWPI